jgi:nucleotide-binding universal stress UspA family protein
MAESINDDDVDFQPKQILVPVDFSGPSGKALKYAHALAEGFGGIIHLVHIVEPVPVLVGIGAAPVPVPVDDPKTVAELERHLVKLAKELPSTFAGRTIVRPGWAVDEVTAVAKELGVDLLVLATHGHSGIGRILFGSTAEGIVRKAPCDVLVVRPDEREFIKTAKTPEKRFTFFLKSILVPIDFSNVSRKALGYAITFALRLKARLICLHVVEVLPYAEWDAALTSQVELIRKAVIEETQRTLQDFIGERTVDIPREDVLTFGSASREIIQIAENRKVDLIMMGAHGKAGPGRFLLGGTTERVLRHASAPVLVVKK